MALLSRWAHGADTCHAADAWRVSQLPCRIFSLVLLHHIITNCVLCCAVLCCAEADAVLAHEDAKAAGEGTTQR